MLNFSIRMDSLLNAAISGSGANSASFDTSKAVGMIALNVAARASGTNTMAIAVTHSSDNVSFTAVPASALYNIATGEADTFDSVTTAATDQTLGLVTQQLKQYVRVELTGSTLTQNVAVTLAYQPQATGNS